MDTAVANALQYPSEPFQSAMGISVPKMLDFLNDCLDSQWIQMLSGVVGYGFQRWIKVEKAVDIRKAENAANHHNRHRVYQCLETVPLGSSGKTVSRFEECSPEKFNCHVV